MAFNARKTEHSGAKKGRGAFYGRKNEAKRASNRRRRQTDKRTVKIMAHHKRKRPKNRRAGCLLCKPWKVNGFAKSRVGAEQFGDHRRRLFAERAVRLARQGESD